MLCTPGEQSVAVGKVVEMLSYWEISVYVSFIVSLSGGRMGRGRGGIILAEALRLAVLAIVGTNLLLERFPRTSCPVQGGRGS